MLRILSFNILAPIFASPQWYPENINKKYLKEDHRLPKILNFINTQKDKIDIFCFQEVTCKEFIKIEELLSENFVGDMAYNDKDYWNTSIVKPLKYKPHGNAIFVNKNKFTNIKFQIKDLKTGNKCIGVLCKKSNKYIRTHSVHFDSDNVKNRELELITLLESIKNDNILDVIDVIAGDINSDTQSTDIGKIFKKYKFINALKKSKHTPYTSYTPYTLHTHPWDPRDDNPSMNAMIDHIMIHNSKSFKSKIFSFDIMKYKSELKRINKTLRLLGSDHFPIKAHVIT